jgi:hypothetical protein
MFSLAPDNWKRLAPITLPGEKPVAQLIADIAAAVTVLFQPLQHFRLRFRRWQAIDDRGINRDAVVEEAD